MIYKCNVCDEKKVFHDLIDLMQHMIDHDSIEVIEAPEYKGKEK